MKTILIAHNYSEVSFASMSYRLAHFTAKKGNRVIFISHRPYFKEKKVIKNENGGELIIISWSSYERPTGVKDIIYFTKIYLKYKPSVIIGHFVGANITTILSKLLSFGKTQTLVYYHTLSSQNIFDSKLSSIKQRVFKIRKKMFYNVFVDLLICPSLLSKNDAIQHFNLSEKKAIVVLNAIKDRIENKEIVTPSGKIIVSYLGRLDSSKNVLLLIESFLQFKIETKDREVLLQIAGDGEEREKIQEYADLNSNIQFYGKLDYVLIDKYLQESSYTIIPSLVDNLPTVGLESLMNGTPLLISTKTGLSAYCIEGVDCYKFLPTKEDIIKAFIKIINNKKNSFEMSKNARKTYEEKFSILRYEQTIFNIIIQDK